MSSALTRTRAAGDALKEIESLHVLLYGENGELKETWGPDDLTDYNVSEEVRTDADAENGHKAETQTKRATFTLPDEIDFGRYYMYAVANIPDLLTAYRENIKTVDGLKSLPLAWNPADVAANGQMIGCFTDTAAARSGDELLVVNTRGVKLHAWLRRAASKVTVAYDGSALKEGVFVYLQSVQIKDIPIRCYLGRDNNVGGDGYALPVTPGNDPFQTDETGTGTTMLDGEIHYYHDGEIPGEDFEYGEACAGHRITAGAPYFGSHDEKASALYFYENMQGAGEHMPDKRQDADGDGALDHPGLPDSTTYRLKDKVKYGTYIEVRAHYVSNNSERLGNGEIIYRFMLGQNETTDYNARRNCHYKLTLKFKNFANEADWHIEYKEPEPGVMVPEPYYITYLYNHSMMLPVKVSTGGHAIESIRAEIIDNRWAPHKADPEIYWSKMDVEGENEWNGFLSLHETTETSIGKGEDASVNANKPYYEQVPKRGERVYENFTPGEYHTTTGSLPTDRYYVEEHPSEQDTYNVYLPMYTRAKQLVASTGYTGNNPYVAYQRKAVVQITTRLRGVEEPFVNKVPIYQVRRIVNPKGIYRSSNNPGTFHVELMRLPGEDAETFVTFQSEGPWKAYIVVGREDDGISLSAGHHGSVERPDDEYGTAIHGKTGSLIDFDVNFPIGDPRKNRYAIIRVEYHNYTCQHLIFVRQGDAPDDLIDGGTQWCARNMRTKAELASSPLDEGSLFRQGNWDQPIDALNNKNNPQKSPWINVTADDFVLWPSEGFDLAGTPEKETVRWADIKPVGAFAEPEIAGLRVATLKDYNELKAHPDIEQGYGVLYGDDADKCAVHIDDAYGYDYKNNKSGKGMRGCFVYNKKTGKSLFFPIGASGYGHRKNNTNLGTTGGEKQAGMLRYAGARTDFMDGSVNARPLFYDLFKRPGAIYWLERQDGDASGWDINYFTFAFTDINSGALNQNQDACFVRCVKKE